MIESLSIELDRLPDVMLGHACFMSDRSGSVADEMINLKGYINRIAARTAFEKAMITKPKNYFREIFLANALVWSDSGALNNASRNCLA